MRRSNDLSNEELELIQPNEELTCDESIKLFLEDCKIRNLRDETVKYYYYELKAYVRLMKDSGVEPAPQNVTSADIKTHVIVQMRDLGRKTVTVNTRLRAIRSYFNFLVRCSPHTFRHTMAKFSVQSGADVFTLQAVLGHSSLEMARVYVHLFSSDVYENHKKFSPIERLY